MNENQRKKIINKNVSSKLLSFIQSNDIGHQDIAHTTEFKFHKIIHHSRLSPNYSNRVIVQRLALKHWLCLLSRPRFESWKQLVYKYKSKIVHNPKPCISGISMHWACLF